jgi:CheY-like chemotaxis protein
MNKIRILLVEDHETVRKGIKLLINEQNDMEVEGEADNGETACELAGEISLDIIVMDISMPAMNGLKASRRLKQICPEVKILTLTRHMDGGYVQQLIQAGTDFSGGRKPARLSGAGQRLCGRCGCRSPADYLDESPGADFQSGGGGRIEPVSAADLDLRPL